MSHQTLVICLTFAIIQSVASLNCYECSLSEGEKCENTNSCSKHCGQYTLKYFDNSAKVFKGCVDQNKCEDIRNSYADGIVTVKHCNVCKKDLCNSGFKIKSFGSFVLLLILVFVCK